MSSTLPPSQVTPAIPAVVIVVDSSFTLAREWRHILIEYCTPLFARLAEGHPAFPQLRLGFVTYGPPDCDGSPIFVNRFFAVGVHNELKDTSRLAIGSTTTGGSLGMAALDGYAAAIEMFDTLKSGVNQKPLRPLSLNESRDRPKEVFSYHLWHFAAGQPDDAKHPRWNRSPALDSLTWKTVPAELKKREINCSMLLVSRSPKFSKLFSDISDVRLAPWFLTRPNHTILLSGFAPSPKPRAAVPSTIPAKRPAAESPAEQRSPGPKISKPSSQTASPALSAAKKPLPQSSPLIASATASSAPPSSSATSPSVPPATAPNSSPPKPPPREPSDGAVIDLTQPTTTEVVPATIQSGRAPPPQPTPLQQAPPTTQPQPQTTQPPHTPQSQGQSSMQPQPQPSPFALNMKPTASADPMEMVAKLKQVEMRITELRSKQLEAAQAGRTEDANKFALVLSQHIAAYKKGREFMVKMLEAKRAAAAAQGQGQGQGPSQPAHDPTSTAGTTQHSTPTMAATPQPQPTPNTNPRSTPRLAATPLMAANPNPMSAMNPSPSHVSTNSGVSVGSGSAANANAALLQAFNPAATQIPTQSGLAGLSGSDAHSLTTMQQHGLPHNSNLGQQPMTPAQAAQMRKLVEQRGLAQTGQTLIPGNNAGTTNGGSGAPVAPAMAGGFGENRDIQWVGTFVWQGTDTARNEKKEVRAQIVATAPSGNPMASTWPKVLNLSPAGPAVQMNELQEWMKRTQPVLMRVQPAPGTDDHGFGQLIKLLRERSFYAVTGWEIPGTGRTTTNLLIAPFSQGLLGAAFPVSGMPEMPKPRVVPPPVDPSTVRLDPAVRQVIFNMLPPQLRNFPEPQLSHIITQLYLRQQQRTQNVAALSQQHQQAQQQQQQQQQQAQQQHQQQTQQQPDRFPQNPGVNMAANGSMFGNLALKQGELNPFVPGSQANTIASGLMIQPTTSLEQLQQRQQQAQQQQQQQAQAQQQAQQQQAQQQQQQKQQAQQNQQRAILDMQRVLSGGLGAGVGAGLGGGLMNTGAGGGALGMSGGGLGSQHGPGFGNGNGGNGMTGAGIGLGLSGAGFSALGGATGMDGAGGGGGAGAGEGLNGMGANAVTMDMFQSFLHRNGEGQVN